MASVIPARPGRTPPWPPADFDASTPVLLLRLDANVFHHGSLGVIRSLGRLGVPVYAVQEDPLAPASASRYLRGRFFWRPGEMGIDQIISGLARLAERIGRPAVVLATDDAGALLLAEHGASLRRWFLFPDPPAGLTRRVADKHLMYLLCQHHGMATPVTAAPSSAAEALDFAGRVGYPLVAKRVRPWHAAAHAASRNLILRSRGELAQLCAAWPPDGSMLLQEYIPPGRDVDWFFQGYCDATSSPVLGFTGVKERSYPTQAGLTTFGRAVRNDPLREEVERLLRVLSYRGMADLDLRFDTRERRYKLVDFNPRLGAQFRVFVDHRGMDIPRSAYLDLTGQRVPEQAGWSERRLLVENYELLAALGHRRRGELDLRSWIRQIRQADEAAWYARDDLAPFGLMCLRMAWRAARRVLPEQTRRPATAPPRYRPGRAAGRDRGGTVADPVTARR